MTSHRPRRWFHWSRGLIAVFGALALALSGCGDNGGTSAGEAGKVDGSSIVIQTVSGLQPNWQKYAEAYMKEFPNRKVEVRATTDDGAAYAQQLATARISGSLPDVLFNVDYLADTLAKNNVTMDLAPGISQGKLGNLRINDFLPQFVGQYRPLEKPDEVTGLPVSADSVALFYNKTAFKKAGVSDFPTTSSSWQDLYRIAAEVNKKSNGKVIGLSAPIGNGNGQIVFGPVLKAFGAKFYDPSTNTVDIGSEQADQAWKLLLGAYGDVSGPYSASPSPDKSQTFDSGNVAMAIATSANVPQTRQSLADQDWDVLPMPKINGKSTAGGGSYGLAISQTSKNQDAAWAFLSWFYNTDQGMKLAQQIANVIPPTNDGIDHGTWRSVTPPKNIASFAESARSAVLLTQLPGTASSTLADATVKATQEVVLKNRPIDEAFAEAQKTVNAQLAKDAPKGK